MKKQVLSVVIPIVGDRKLAQRDWEGAKKKRRRMAGTRDNFGLTAAC